ncbi:hypothetical protein L1987_61225 [Smallanthus sonchifolius]|uniref:Uncharacterized protein n=1 Tax=Smallanthus sonchifolius TaxID=185202 RepID=A0ACB9DAL7_9ASTR|nr:hypothetical protein L1987_61225 [Smallanthus sonchifolius]
MVINDLVHDTESMQYFSQPSVPDSIYERIPSFTMQDDTWKELFKKIVSNGHVEIPLGRLAREAIGDSCGKDFLGKMVTKVGNKMKAQKDDDLVVAKRDVSVDDELSQKLERFKVKTVNIGGVVKEGQK